MEHDQKNQLLEFYCPKICKETARQSRERVRERYGIKAFHTTKLITGYGICCSSNPFSLFYSIRDTQFYERVSTENIWACSPKGDRERKKMLVSKIANAQIIKFTMEFTIENTQEIEQYFYKPNIEVSDLHVGGWGWWCLNLAFKFQHCYNPVSGITSVTVLF